MSYGSFNVRVRDVKKGRIKHTDRVASVSEVENYDENMWKVPHEVETKVWHGCNCNSSSASAVVLDPFAGSGTTLMKAMKRRLNAIGIEINPKYIDLIKRRCKIPNLLYDYELIQ